MMKKALYLAFLVFGWALFIQFLLRFFGLLPKGSLMALWLYGAALVVWLALLLRSRKQ